MRAVLGDQTSSVTTCGEDKDGTSVLLSCGSDGSNCDGLDGLGGTGLDGSELVEERREADGRLGEKTSLGHHED